jgi:hypothetical protein
MKTVYQLDATGLLLEAVEADPSPLEPGQWLIPGGCVDAPTPPALAANEALRWVDGVWTVLADFRGHSYWLADGSFHTIDTAGATPPAEALYTEPEPVPRLPTAVTMRQARLALLGAGLLSAVNAAVAAMPDVAGDAARIEWEFSPVVKRDSPFVLGISAALALTTEQLDALFTSAATL